MIVGELLAGDPEHPRILLGEVVRDLGRGLVGDAVAVVHQQDIGGRHRREVPIEILVDDAIILRREVLSRLPDAEDFSEPS